MEAPQNSNALQPWTRRPRSSSTPRTRTLESQKYPGTGITVTLARVGGLVQMRAAGEEADEWAAKFVTGKHPDCKNGQPIEVPYMTVEEQRRIPLQAVRTALMIEAMQPADAAERLDAFTILQIAEDDLGLFQELNDFAGEVMAEEGEVPKA